jgi:hypothetical protein
VPQLTKESIHSIVYSTASSQSLSARNNYSCAYHNFNVVNQTIVMASRLEVELLPLIDKIALELKIQPDSLHQVLFLLPLGLGFKSYCFEIDELGLPLASNKMKSWVQLLTTMGSLGYELTNEVFHILRSIILHKSADQLKGDIEIQFAQLLSELCTKGYSLGFDASLKDTQFGINQESSGLDNAFVFNVLYLIELELRRTQPLSPGSAFNRANSYFNEQGYDAIANNTTSNLIEFTRNKFVGNIQSKIEGSVLANSPTLLQLLDRIFSNHLEMANYLASMAVNTTSEVRIHKQALCDRALLNLDIPSV